MGILTPQKNELELLQRFFEEKVKLIGVEGFYHEVKDHKIDALSSYDKMEYFDPIRINFLFEEMPTPKTLKSLNWWDDSEDTVPPIAQLPWHVDQNRSILLKPSIGSLLEVVDPYSGQSRYFEIQQINANSFYMIYSICKLSPARFQIREKRQKDTPVRKEGGGYEYLNIPK